MYVLEYTIVPHEIVKFKIFPGFYLRGFFFRTLKSVNEELARMIHESKKFAPYSIRTFENSSGIVFKYLKVNEEATFSFIFLDENLFENFRDAFLSLSSIKILNTEIRVTNIRIRKISFKDIYSNSSSLTQKFSIDFLTPTSFKIPLSSCCKHCQVYKKLKARINSKEKDLIELKAIIRNRRGVLYPLPDIKLAFFNILRMIRYFEGKIFDIDEFNSWLDNESIVLAGYEEGIRTIRYYEHPTSNKFFVGFVGRVQYSVRNMSEKMLKIASSLLYYAEITNIGHNRTAGFGRIKVLPQP